MNVATGVAALMPMEEASTVKVALPHETQLKEKFAISSPCV
jgi:hypothetical protein